MIKIKGTIFHNFNYAHISIKKQLSYFPKKIRHVHLGTINLKLKQPLLINQYDFKTKRIKWHKKYSKEYFLFKSCYILVKGKSYPAWIYKASKSENNISSNVVEVLAEKISFGNCKTVSLCFLKSKRIDAINVY